MDNNLKSLIAYRVARAHETFDEALLMQGEGHWNACMNRLYYACFYAATALLAKNALSTSKHSGVKAFFNQYFVKTGKISRKHGTVYNHLFENRQEGDYVDFVLFDADVVNPLIPRAKEFIEVVCSLAVQD